MENNTDKLNIFITGDTCGKLNKDEIGALLVLTKHINNYYTNKEMNIVVGKDSVMICRDIGEMRRQQIKREGIKINLQIAAIVLAMFAIVIILLQRLCQL